LQEPLNVAAYEEPRAGGRSPDALGWVIGVSHRIASDPPIRRVRNPAWWERQPAECEDSILTGKSARWQ
jgi:hypothetical protein